MPLVWELNPALGPLLKLGNNGQAHPKNSHEKSEVINSIKMHLVERNAK
jgi:hypothetical protein